MCVPVDYVWTHFNKLYTNFSFSRVKKEGMDILAETVRKETRETRVIQDSKVCQVITCWEFPDLPDWREDRERKDFEDFQELPAWTVI